MAEIPDLEALVGEVLAVSGERTLVFPGGAALSASIDVETGDPLAIVRGLLAQAAPAMAPLKPVFDIIDAIKATLACIEVIPEAIVTLQPQKIIDAAAELAAKVAALANILPQVSIPIFAVGILDSLIDFLVGLRRKLRAFISAFDRVVAAETKATTLASSRPGVSVQLQISASASRVALEAQVANENAALSPVNRLIVLLNVFLKMAGLPCVPTLGSIGQVGEPALEVLDSAIGILQGVRSLLEPFVPSGQGPGTIPSPDEPC